MDIFAYGVTTRRYDSALPWWETKILVPVTSNIVVWDWVSLKREKVFQYNTNAIMSLVQNSSHIFSISYNGEIAVIDIKTLELVKVF
jgi:hypothetical protein